MMLLSFLFHFSLKKFFFRTVKKWTHADLGDFKEILQQGSAYPFR